MTIGMTTRPPWARSAREVVSVAEAKAKLAHCIRQVEAGVTVVITRHSRAVAILVAPSELAEIERLRQAGPQGGLASLAGGWEGSDRLMPDDDGPDQPAADAASTRP